jgi:hypothetical protein
MTLTRRGKTLLLVTYILTILYLGWNLMDIFSAIEHALHAALYTIAHAFGVDTGASPQVVPIPSGVPEGWVEIQTPADWGTQNDTFPCTFDSTLTCYLEPAPTN